MNRDILADLLARAAGTYNRRHRMAIDPELRAQRCRELNEPGVLSIGAIAAIVGTSVYHVENALGDMPKATTRGKLNPSHIPWLAYMLSTRKVNDEWLKNMLADGTSLSTISDLTNISEATLHRRK